MARSRNFAGRGRRPNRRLYTWFPAFEIAGGANFQIIGGVSTSSLANGFFATEDSTIIRQHYSLGFGTASNQDNAADGISVGVGVAVVSAQAALAGAVPLPLTDAGFDGWMLHRTLMYVSETGSDSILEEQAELSTKSMRILHGGEALVFVVEALEAGTAVFSATNRIDLLVNGRILFKTN